MSQQTLDCAYAAIGWTLFMVTAFFAIEAYWLARSGLSHLRAWRTARSETKRVLGAWRASERHGKSTVTSLLILLLASCAAPTPRVIAPPPVCPALPERPPQTDTRLPEFLPTLSPDTTDATAAGEILRVRVDSAAQYQACRANNAALADWIIHHSQE